jgi:alpha-L-fucosidase
VEAGLTPPRAETLNASRDAASGAVTLEGNLKDLGGALSVEVGFEYRSLKALDVNERIGAWHSTPLRGMTATGSFSVRVEGWKSGEPYEFRSLVKHPLLTVRGEAKRVIPK